MDNFTQAFQHNFYLSQEYAIFCSKIIKIPLRKQMIGNQTIFVFKNKNISINNYSDILCRKFKNKNISYLRVMPEINNTSYQPSFIEYSIFHKTTYNEAFGRYKTSFLHGLREGKKIPHKVKIIRRPNNQLIEKIYHIYADQMKRHNSLVFPLSFFKEFLKSPSSLLFIIEDKKDVIGYFCCFQYKDNIYTSIGGGNPRYFSYKCSNKLYDELIRYACHSGLNIHLGIGEHGSGYQKFKQNAGVINYKTERFPDDKKLMKLVFPLLKFKTTGKVLGLVSKFFPHFILYLMMPFT